MRRLIKKTALITMLIMSCQMTFAQNAAKILGKYKVISDTTNEVVHVMISEKGDTYQAQIVWLEKPFDDKGQLRRDKLNPDPALRSVLADRVILAWGLKYDRKANEWSGGKIYDPDTGKTYKAVLKFENSTNLKVRGYIGMPTFGRTMTWKRIE